MADNKNHSDSPEIEHVFDPALTEAFAENSFQILQQRKDRKRIIMRVAIVVFTIIALLIAAAASAFFFFRISYITVKGNQFYSADEIIHIAGIEPGSSLLLVDRAGITNNLLREMPHIYNITVEIILPSTIQINIIEDSPILYFVLAEHYVVLSRELRVLEVFAPDNADRNFLDRLYSTQLPEIVYANYGHAVRFASPLNNRFIIDLIDAIEASPMAGRVNQLDMSNRFDINVLYDDRFIVHLGNRELFDIKLSFAHAMTERFVPYASGVIDARNHREGSVIPNLTEYFIDE